MIKSSELLHALVGKISKEVHAKASAFIEANRNVSLEKAPLTEPHELDYKARGQLCQNKIAKRLFDIMTEKQTNLCLSADYTKMDQILDVSNRAHLSEMSPTVFFIKRLFRLLIKFSFDGLN